MSNFSSSEDELGALRDFWDRHGKVLLAAVLVAICLLAGKATWKWYQERYNLGASAKYAELLLAKKNNDVGGVTNLATEIVQNYQKSPYSALASLLLAKQAVESSDFAKAEEHLRWVQSKHKGEVVANLAKIRLVRLFLANAKYQQGLDLLTDADSMNEVFHGKYAELKGDIYKAMDLPTKALEEYKLAQKMAANEQFKMLLNMKIADLPKAESENFAVAKSSVKGNEEITLNVDAANEPESADNKSQEDKT